MRALLDQGEVFAQRLLLKAARCTRSAAHHGSIFMFSLCFLIFLVYGSCTGHVCF